jgi:hypothetical protein
MMGLKGLDIFMCKLFFIKKNHLEGHDPFPLIIDNNRCKPRCIYFNYLTIIIILILINIYRESFDIKIFYVWFTLKYIFFY